MDFADSRLANRDKKSMKVFVKVFCNSFIIHAVKCSFCGFRELPDHFRNIIGAISISQNLISKEIFLSNLNFAFYLVIDSDFISFPLKWVLKTNYNQYIKN